MTVMMTLLLRVVVSFVLYGTSLAAASTVFGFTNVHGDHMVLQRAPNKAQVYGTSPDINDVIKVTLYDAHSNVVESVLTEVNAEQQWSAQFSPQPASMNGETYSVVAESVMNSNDKAELKDILFGDVFVCSGQSNMEFTVDSAFNATQEVSAANNYPNIRLLSVAQTSSVVPLYEVLSLKQKWSLASSEGVGGGNWSYFSAVCWFFGKNLYDELSVPLGLIGTNYGGTPVRDWMSDDAKSNCPNETSLLEPDAFESYRFDEMPIDRKNSPSRKLMSTAKEVGASSGGLWNAMIVPFLNMTIKGAIWYQGEADSTYPYAYSYKCGFPAMIADWRYQWNSNSDTNTDFSFGFVHLSTWDDTTNQTCQSTCQANTNDCDCVATVRHGQTADYGFVPNPKMPNTYMATAIDLGDATSPFGDVHPRYKQQVARRLSNAALNQVYGESQLYTSGPIADAAQLIAVSNMIDVHFRNVNQAGLLLNSLIGFEVFDDPSQQWVYVTPNDWNVQLVSPWNVEIYYYESDGVTKPSQIRYNFYQAPCAPAQGIYGCAVYDRDSMLPALPFILTLEA